MKPLKKFGQNYLQDSNIIAKIIAELSPEKDDTIIEIGPGLGALTKQLNQSGAKVFAIEIDNRVIKNLKKQFPNVSFIQNDFLKLDLHFFNSELRVIGNIPYNITSPIIFKIFENRVIIRDAVIMMQDEVAKRLVANPSTKDYGILSVLSGFYSDVKYCFKISPNVFFPKPKVNSALVHFKLKEELEYDDPVLFNKVVKASFGNRRKTLKNSLKNSIFGDCDLSKIEFDLSKRAEELTRKDFVELTCKIKAICNR